MLLTRLADDRLISDADGLASALALATPRPNEAKTSFGSRHVRCHYELCTLDELPEVYEKMKAGKMVS